MKTSAIRVSVVGAAGYAGGEVLRLLSRHPNVVISKVVSESSAGLPVQSAFPGFGKSSLVFSKLDLDAVVAESDVVILGQENGFAMKHAEKILGAGKKLIDISADFRLKDPALYPVWYKFTHASAALLERAVYGLPELHREKIRGSALIGNPGCYPTASILALAPLAEKQLIETGSIVIDAKSGVSGAGRSKHVLDYHFPELNESVRAYGVGGVHRHTPEIEQELARLSGTFAPITFTPHLVPITRGIISTCYATPKSAMTAEALHSLFAKRYENEAFVTVLPLGQFPSTKGTYATNQCHIGVAVDSRTGRLIVVSAIDNLGKGAAGQAVQNLNLICGIDEGAGIDMPGVWP